MPSGFEVVCFTYFIPPTSNLIFPLMANGLSVTSTVLQAFALRAKLSANNTKIFFVLILIHLGCFRNIQSCKVFCKELGSTEKCQHVFFASKNFNFRLHQRLSAPE